MAEALQKDTIAIGHALLIAKLPVSQQQEAFNAAFRYMRNRIAAFVALPLKSLDALSLKAKLSEIGRLDGATEPAMEAKP